VLRVLADPEALAHAVARELIEASALERPCRVALSGGTTPRHGFELLATPPLGEQVAWERLEVFWGDERCVSPEDSRSNERMARESLLDRVAIPRAQIHPIRCSGDSRQAAREYEALLLQSFGGPPRFDLALLGLGADAHTASLKPGSPALRERERLVVAVPDVGEGFDRVTLTAPAINQARKIVFAVSGRSKALALREVLEGRSRPEQYPAQLIRPVDGELLWLVDEEAASLLSAQASPRDAAPYRFGEERTVDKPRE
jgi:6-phosphogluconolactonase